MPEAPDIEVIVKIGDAVEYIDEVSRPHVALVTNVFGMGDENSSLNVIYASDDSTQTDPYGRQVVRQTSCVPEKNQSAHGRFWRLLK